MSAPNDYLVVYVTAPAEEAPILGRQLVERRVAACVNVVPAVRSIYHWEGAVHDDNEALLIIKTRRDRFAALRDAVASLHSYSVPEIIALEVTAGHRPYLDWIDQHVQGASE